MADLESKQAVDEARANQRIYKLAERVTKRQILLANDIKRKEFEESSKEVIRWIRWDAIKWLQDNGCTGEKPGQYCHTSKPFTDAIASADGFVGNTFGEDDWVKAMMEEDALNDVDIVQAWTQKISKYLMNHYRYGSWMMIQPATALDSLTFGNALTYTGKENRSIYHKRCNILNAYIKRLSNLHIGQIHYIEPYMAGEAYEKWGDKLSPTTCRAAVDNPTQRVEVIRCVYGVEDAIFNDLSIKMDDTWTHYEVLIEKDSVKNTSAYDDKDPMCGVLESAGYSYNPFSDWPYWLPSSEDGYGWSAYGSALISVKRLHAAYKGLTNAVQQATDPSMKTTLENKNKIDLRPGRFSYLDRADAVLEETYKRGIQYPLTIDFIERMEAELEEVLHLSLYQAMTQRTKEMTVPEVLEVIGEKARQLAPRIGTRQYLYDNPIHEKTLTLAKILGQGPLLNKPAGLDEVIRQNKLNPEMRFIYSGPLAQANQMVMLSRKTQGALTLLVPLAQMGEKAAQEVQDSMKAGVWAEHILDTSGIEQDVVTTEEEKKQIQQQRATEMKAQMTALAAQTAKTATEGERNMAQASQMVGQ